jgi:DNA-binding protein YbaB
MTQYEIRPASWRVGPIGSPSYSELVTEVAITDEAGGEFVEVRQDGRTDIGKICIDPGEWPALRAAINRAVRACREDNELEGPLE